MLKPTTPLKVTYSNVPSTAHPKREHIARVSRVTSKTIVVLTNPQMDYAITFDRYTGRQVRKDPWFSWQILPLDLCHLEEQVAQFGIHGLWLPEEKALKRLVQRSLRKGYEPISLEYAIVQCNSLGHPHVVSELADTLAKAEQRASELVQEGNRLWKYRVDATYINDATRELIHKRILWMVE